MAATRHDDACAILLAAYHPALHLLGISTVYGNSSLTKTTNNALAVLEAIGKPEVPVFPGAAKPFCRIHHSAVDIHGESGLDGTDLLPVPSRKPLKHVNAIKEMRDSIMACAPNTAWIVPTGTLTNVALLFATFPEVVDHIKGLSIMGGAIGGEFSDVYLGPEYTGKDGQKHKRVGNTTPFAEFNIWCDAEASNSVFRNPVLRKKTYLIPLDITHQAVVTKDIREMLLYGLNKSGPQPTRLRRMFNELLMFFAHTYDTVFAMKEGPPLHDPLAVAILLWNHADEETRINFDDRGGERWNVDVVLSGEQVGRTVAVSEKAGIVIPRTLDLKKFWQTLEECMERADQATGKLV
ncbi:Uridine nucleosidase [Cyphellophora attinorum]|uniref:Uridine nucleosidase n=1 Tax=Cyphellophora attinorum TaxID=1664694 RepID=A0A0N1H686_9EURO|nr:Uridine nucleosidase [Phialophora attinorum]KPI36775.1 Uridine nucleosidase [Phialophora attinorum]